MVLVGLRSFSEKVSRSSLAELQWEFVHRIVEDEVDGQGERKGRWERRKTAKRGKLSSRRKSDTQHKRIGMTHGLLCAHAKLAT